MSKINNFNQHYATIIKATAILLVVCRQWQPATASSRDTANELVRMST